VVPLFKKISHRGAKALRTRGEKFLKKTFTVSLCYQGAHGGGLRVTEDFIIFKTQTMQLPKEMQFIQIAYTDIENIINSNSLVVFPSISIKLKCGLIYKFIVFNRKNCLRIINERLGQIGNINVPATCS
jgi:hypothetical protein